MIHIFLVFFIFIFLVLLLGFSANVGRRFGHSQLTKHTEHKLEVVDVAENAVLTLLGLMIAFTFFGAYDRYESRKLHILEEANIFDTAYEYIDLVPQKYQPSLRENVRQYLDLHLAAFHHIPDLKKVDQDLYKALDIQHKIWQTVVTAGEENPNSSLTQLFIPTMSKMFDIAHSGINMTRIHPPGVIFILLIGLATLGAFLIGYNSAEIKQPYSLHVICYVLITAFTIYLIMNLEFPRVGFIRFNTFDQMLMDVRDDMNDR